MSDAWKGKKRPLANTVRKYIGEFPDLFYNGSKIMCKVCDKPLMCWDKSDCRKHVNSIKHTNKKCGVPPKEQFMFDLLFMLLASGLQLRLLNKESFRHFWNKYNPKSKLPSRTGLHNYLPSLREEIERRIKAELKDKQLWLCVSKTTDRKKNYIIHVIVRVLEPFKPTFPILLASKRLEICNVKEITIVVLDTLEKFQLSTSQLLMFVTDGTPIMRSVGCFLKEDSERPLHVTCQAHALHLVTQAIQDCFPEVDALITKTARVFLKSPKRTREFYKRCPGIPKPPELILTHWGTWLKAAFYYSQYFQQVKSAILQFNPEDATAIKESQTRFQDASVETDLRTICNNYKGLLDAIEKLQNTRLPLVESVQIVDKVNIWLCNIVDARNSCIIEKFDSVIKNDSDFIKLRQIYDGVSADPLAKFKDYFNYACVTSVDVKRSFSKYESIFSSRRTSFTETNVETYVMLQTFHQSHLAQFMLCDKQL